MSNTSYRALRTQPQYLKLIAANIINRFGDSIDAIAFSWMMYEVTGSASLMALNLAVNMLPTILLQPLAGALVDQRRKRPVMMLCDVGRGVIVALIAGLLLLGLIRPWMLLSMTFLISCLEAFRIPAGSSIVPRLLAEEHYPSGIALNATLGRIAELVGTAAAGVIVAAFGSALALAIDAAAFFLSALLIRWIRDREPKPAERASVKQVKTSFMEGLRYARGNRLLIAIMVMGLVLNAVMVPTSAFSTAYVVDYLKAGPAFLSVMQLVLTGAMALGAFLTPRIPWSKRTLFTVLGMLIGITVSAFWFYPMIAPPLWRSVAFLIGCGFMGMAIGILNVAFNTIFMQYVDKEFLGRVGGLTNSVLCCAIPLVSLLCSGLALVAEIPLVLLISGLMIMAAFFAIMRFKVYTEL